MAQMRLPAAPFIGENLQLSSKLLFSLPGRLPGF